MQPITIIFRTLEVKLKTGPDIYDITAALNRLTADSLIIKGTLWASMIGSTGSLTTIEYEPGVIEDLKKAINRLPPPGMEYAHEKAWHDGNGHSHVQATIAHNGTICRPCRQKRVS